MIRPWQTVPGYACSLKEGFCSFRTIWYEPALITAISRYPLYHRWESGDAGIVLVLGEISGTVMRQCALQHAHHFVLCLHRRGNHWWEFLIIYALVPCCKVRWFDRRVVLMDWRNLYQTCLNQYQINQQLTYFIRIMYDI